MNFLKTKLFLAFFISTFFLFGLAGVSEVKALDIIPGLKGFGTDTRAAYGAVNDPIICIVTDLTVDNIGVANSVRNGVSVKTGSFLECVNYAPPPNTGKIILFEVSGTIGTNSSQTKYHVRTPFTTIAGQTAPSPGVLVKNCGFTVMESHAVVQHLRFRGSHILKNGVVLGAGTYNGGGGYYNVQNVVIDHCSASWSGESNILVHNYEGGTTKNITISNCISSEGLRWEDPDHPTAHYNNGKGAQISQNTEFVSHINNLYASNYMRNPYIRGKSAIVANCLSYNPGDAPMSVQGLNHVGLYSFKGNVVKGGPWSFSKWSHNYFLWLSDLVYSDSEVYAEDNRCDDVTTGDTAYVQSSSNDWSRIDDERAYHHGPFEAEVKVFVPPVWPNGLTSIPSSEVEAHIIANVGARPIDRDSVDTRLINDVQNGTGNSNHITSVPIWPVLAENTITLDIPSNPHDDNDGDGYTNLEEWLHGLAAVVEGGSSDTAIPIVTSFTSNKTTVNTNDSITFSWTVTDETALKQVELYRKIDAGAWIQVPGKIQLVNGTSASGIFTDVPTTAGAYQYGLHVVDQAGNVGTEPAVISVMVNSAITGTSYFVKPSSDGGNDGNTGLSDAQAWATISKVNSHNFQTGDNVFFKCGGTWAGTYIFVDWDGVSDNRIVIGAYYGDGTIGVNGDRPVIDGNDIAPADNYDGLITIENREYITVENIHIKRSAGYGVWVYQSNNILVDNIYIKRTYMQGVYFRTSSYCTLQYSDVSETCRYGNGSVVAFWDSDHVNINYNILHETSNEQIVMNSGREGINFLHSDNSAAIGNVIYDCKGMGIYIDHAQHATVKNNLIYYTGNKAYWRSATKPSSGIVFTDEEAQGPHHLTRDVTVTNNLIANCGKGITLWSGTSNDNDPALINVVLANNIIVEPVSIDETQRAIELQASSRHSNTIIKNNIFWQSAGQIAYVVPDPDLLFSNNLWSQPKASIDTDAQGSGDVYGQVPQLAKTTGWNSLTGGELNGSDFTLQSTSPAINAGTNLGAPYNQGLNSASTWVNNISTLDQNSYGSWEIGAFVYADVPPASTDCEDDLGGVCCSATQFCDGGSSPTSSDCSNVCCVGGTCEDIAPDTTCESEDYQCCDSCHSGEHKEYDGDCHGQVCCEYCSSGLPPLPLTCEGEGYKCCSSPCKLDAPPEYNSDCASGICCAVCPVTINPPPKVEMDNFISALDFPKLIQNLLSLTLSIVGSLALLMLIFGGVMYVGSTGDEQKILTAKKIVTYAIGGLILILLAYSIAMVLNKIMT